MSLLAIGPDGRWAAFRTDNALVLHDLISGEAIADRDVPGDGEQALLDVGADAPVLVVVTRVGDDVTEVITYSTPTLEEVAYVELIGPHRLMATIGARLALLRTEDRRLLLYRCAPRALMATAGEFGSEVDVAVGLERQQLLVGSAKRVEILDAVSGRSVARLGMPLPPPPRQVGAAAGHLWAYRQGGDELHVFRMSDGRPWVQRLGGPIEEVISHGASSMLVATTQRGAARLHCLTRTIETLALPDSLGLALAVREGQAFVVGIDPSGATWRLPLSTTLPVAGAEPTHRAASDADRREERDFGWRDGLWAWLSEAERGNRDLPPIGPTSNLAELIERLPRGAPRRLVVALYASYLQGQPRMALAKAARIAGEGGWREALGGAAHAAGFTEIADGHIQLAPCVSRYLDGARASALRIAGDRRDATVLSGVHRLALDELTTAPQLLAGGLGRVGWVVGPLDVAMREAAAYGVTAAIDVDGWLAHGSPVDPLTTHAGLVVVHTGEPPTELLAVTAWGEKAAR